MTSDCINVKYANLKLDILEFAHALKVIYALQMEGATSKSVLYSMISTNGRTIKDRIDTLSEVGLIEEIAIDKPPYRALQLTKKGKEMAEHIVAIERILNR